MVDAANLWRMPLIDWHVCYPLVCQVRTHHSVMALTAEPYAHIFRAISATNWIHFINL
jgi:hypothetical protein